MRQVTASGGSAARGRPLPASATVQRLQACTRRRWLTGPRGYAVHGLGADSRQAPGRSRDIPRSLHDSVAGRTAGGMRHVTASVLVGRERGVCACRPVVPPRRYATGRRCGDVRLEACGGLQAPRHDVRAARYSAVETRAPGEPHRVLLTGFEAAPVGAAAVLPRYYLGYLNSWSIRGKRWKGSWGPALDAEFRSGTGRPGN